MKKLNLFLVALLSVGIVSAQNWSLDKAHAKLGFVTTHLLISEVEGSFKSFDAKLTSSKDDFSDAVIELTADINSINTDNDGRDKHLKSPDFFDAEKYATLTFKSKAFTKVDAKNYKLTGDLTLHGVTKPVTLDVVYNGTITHPFNKKLVAGFKVKGVVKRSDFSVGSVPTAVVADEIVINGNAEFIKG
jgi:polyisoprenoid-binding protein YceI